MLRKATTYLTLVSFALVLSTPISFADHLPSNADEDAHVSEVTEIVLSEESDAAGDESTIETASEDEDQLAYPRTEVFVISAYYSPLPGQKRYATGSYDADIRLNGNGTHGASGSPVNINMLAAPPEYPFGTKITCPGIGTSEVQDRGGAIKNKRLDKWMGYGDIGLQRALQWGKRSVTCVNHGIDSSIKVVSYIDDYSDAEKFIQGLIQTPQIFEEDLWYKSTGQDVELLKNHLTELGYYKGKINEKFGDDLRKAVLDFQIQYKIVDDESEIGAGNFGPQTRAKLAAILEKRNKENLPQQSLKPGDTGDDVRKLQEALNKLGYIIDVTGEFDDATAQALKRYQIDQGLIDVQEVNVSFDSESLAALTYSVINQVSIRQTVEAGDIPNTVILPNGGLQLGDSGPEVYRLQEQLVSLNYLNTKPNGHFGKFTEHAVFKFQQANFLVGDINSNGAGIFGALTRQKLEELVADQVSVRRLVAEKNDKSGPTLMEFDRDLAIGDRDLAVAELQESLKTLGYFDYQYITDYYGSVTKDAVLAFQLANGIVKSASDQGAGVFGPQTRLELSRLIGQKS